MILENLKRARARLKEAGASDVGNQVMIEDLMKEAQEITEKMNEAKINAMRKAEEPFLERLKELDEQMAVLVMLAN